MKNALLSLLSLLVALELVGWLTTLFFPELYTNRETIRAQLRKNISPRDIRNIQMRLFPETEILVRHNMASGNCVGERIIYRIGQNSERLYNGYSADTAKVLLIGDSYTFGMEVPENDTLGALLYKNNGIMSANLGRTGFDSMQALQYGRYYRDRFPRAKLVVLGIMYENLNRLVASYWPAYTIDQNPHPLDFKPYVRDGEYHPVNPRIFNSRKQLIAAAEKALRYDYWARPAPKFPYTQSLLLALTANSFPDTLRMHKGAREHAQYRYQYQDEGLSKNLRYVLHEYAKWADSEDLIPLVFFIPRSGDDTTSGGEWIERNRDKLPTQLVMRNMDFSNVNPRRYNLKPNGDCHPSAYGSRAIALQYASFINEYLPKEPGAK